MTNAERIRSMNDEGLAKFFTDAVTDWWPWCDQDAPTDEDCNCLKWGMDREDGCEKCCKVWLQKEFDENDGISFDVLLSDDSISELNPCPHCGKKPIKFIWSKGCLDLKCSCGMRESQVVYKEDDADLKGLFEKLKSLWNGEVVKDDDD